MKRVCPVCGTSEESARQFLPDTFDPSRLTPTSYASRKKPEYMSLQLVRCAVCSLAYAPDPPDAATLAEAYRVASYDSSAEADDAARAYLRALQPTIARIGTAEAALEIGSGTGALLRELARCGFQRLVGIEPSEAAIAAAESDVAPYLRHGTFDANAFDEASFDLICCMMTLEHVRDPFTLAEGAHKLLRPRGLFAAVVHDYQSLVNRLLGKRSPIVDIEHLQLFSRKAAAELFARAGFRDVTASTFINTYRFEYWLRLAPLPGVIKTKGMGIARALGFADRKIGCNVGNILVAGFARERAIA